MAFVTSAISLPYARSQQGLNTLFPTDSEAHPTSNLTSLIIQKLFLPVERRLRAQMHIEDDVCSNCSASEFPAKEGRVSRASRYMEKIL